MEELLDIIWFKTIDIVYYIQNLFDLVFSPLNFFGPGIVIFTIALITVLITKFLTKNFKTKLYIKLEKEFKHWYNLRQEALKCEGSGKANKLLAKNIDQAELNEIYWKFFVEGFVISLVTKVLPITIFLSYVNETYKGDNLLKLFGREYIFKLPNFGGNEIVIESTPWFIISLVLIYLGWFIIKRIYNRKFAQIDSSAKKASTR
ncbi:MAG: hypothetical protein U9Q84_07950 [Thermodesulfobacteriota bacterium]|nr:hypothetical protein [Thermodesulfobacteriota bacterium]